MRRSRAANPPPNCGGIRTVLFAELDAKIFFFGCYQNVVARDEARQEQDQRPGQVDGQGDAGHEASHAQVEGIP